MKSVGINSSFGVRKCSKHFLIGQLEIAPANIHTNAKRGGKHSWDVWGTGYEYVTVIPDHFFGIENVWVDERFRIPITDKERTIFETFVSPRLFGGIGEALSTLREHIQGVKLENLVDYAIRYEMLHRPRGWDGLWKGWKRQRDFSMILKRFR